jgi:ABC-type spermidine/putrescine transport system permease subunit II
VTATSMNPTSTTHPPRPARFSLGSWLLPVYSALALAFLLVPIVYTLVFSFNDAGKSNIIWRGLRSTTG